MKLKPILFAAALLTIIAPSASALMEPPDQIKQLIEKAGFVVTAEVLAVESKVEKADPAVFGIGNTNTVFTIRIQVQKVVKGAGLKAGDTITLTTWQAFRRTDIKMERPPGQRVIPKVGQQATFFLYKTADGNYEAICPNGIQTGVTVERQG